LLAGFCWRREMPPVSVHESADLTREFQALLIDQGVEIEWPRLRAL